jgi:hypothetical protein
MNENLKNILDELSQVSEGFASQATVCEGIYTSKQEMKK